MDNDLNKLHQQLDDLHNKFEYIEDAYQKLQKQFKQIEVLSSIISSLAAITDFQEFLKITKKSLRTAFKIQQYSLMLLDKNSQLLKIKSSFGLKRHWTNSRNISNDQSIFVDAIQRQESIFIENTAELDNKYTIFPGIEKQTGSFLCIPLTAEKNKILGVLNLYRDGRNAFSSDEMQILDKIARQFSILLHKVMLYEHTKALSITDDLTGFYNRRYFNQRYERELQRAKRYHHNLCLIMLDIDHFKLYNDINGHLMGDEVLKKIAHTLDNILRKTDFLARYGGEEFIIMLPEISKHQARKVADKLRREIEQTEFPNTQSQPNKQITISLGLAAYPDDARDPKTLIKYADDALYMAKSSGRNCVAWHGKRMQKSAKPKIEKSRTKQVQKV